MQIKRLAATFGRLENAALDLEPGLNVIDAPNEGGKSTWTAFLRVMFYGLSTKDRSPNADKRRYQPWSGSAMAGVMDAATARGEVTVTRRTARANAPMGAFSAVYKDTASPVDFLTAAGCGETLLGVPQDVFERSAYIRQSGLAVDQSAALERRIASLITTGEEDTSFTDAAGQLKKQPNARRHNKTGRLPQLEQAMTELRAAAEELDGLVRSVNRDLAEQDELQAQMEEIRELMARHDEADLTDEYRTVESLRLDVASAHDRVKTLESGSRGLPDRLELETIQGRINALASVDRAVAEAKTRMELAVRAFRTAEAALEAHPMAGKDPSQAASAPLNAPPRPKASPLFLVLALAAGLLTGGALAWFTRIWPAAVGGGLALFAAALLGGLLAFLLFNAHPAKVFMGDTGSLFLGGAVAGMAFAFDMPLILLLVGVIYIVETLSDIIQIVYFKLSHGKRVFKMAPIHHHFEMCGWSEIKIVTVFTAVSTLFCALALFGVMNRMM